LTLLAFVAATCLSQAHVDSVPDTPQPCSAAEFRQFDFWVGEWDLTWTSRDGQEKHGVNRTTRMFGPCAIREEFSADNGALSGTSLSVYVPTERKWKQTWVDDSGAYLDFTGTFTDGRMILGRSARRGGSAFLQRMQWYNITPDSLDWNWERSDDNGTSWVVMWKIHYTRRMEGSH